MLRGGGLTVRGGGLRKGGLGDKAAGLGSTGGVLLLTPAQHANMSHMSCVIESGEL